MDGNRWLPTQRAQKTAIPSLCWEVDFEHVPERFTMDPNVESTPPGRRRTPSAKVRELGACDVGSELTGFAG